MRRSLAHPTAASSVVLFVLLAIGTTTQAAAINESGGSQQAPVAPPPSTGEQAPETQSAESDGSQEQPLEESSPDSSDTRRGRPPLPAFPEPSRPDLTSGQLAVGMGLYFSLFALYSVLSLGIVVFVLAPVVTRRESRWRSPTAQALRWALIGAFLTAIPFVAYEADYSARRSHYMQRYGFSVFPGPERSLADAFWEHFAFDLLAAATMIVCGFAFALGGPWVAQWRRARKLRLTHQSEAPAEADDA